MNCILHIGTEKTGTTTIQDFLNCNRDLLRKHGIVFTKCLGLTNNRALPFLAYEGTREDDYTWHQLLHDRKKRDLARASLLAAISKELGDIPENSTVLFSSEHLQSRLVSPADLIRLSSLLKDLNLRVVKVLVYLRNPVEGAVSLLSTGIKGPATTVALPSSPSHHISTVFDHKATILRWAEVFGSDTICPRLFLKDCFHDGNLIQDFIQASGLPTLAYKTSKSKNESLDMVGMELLARFNRKIPALIDRIPNRLRADVVSYFERHLTQGNRFVPSEEIVDAYENYFSESNEWVRTQFFPDRERPLFPKARLGDAPITIESGVLDQVANLIVDIWSAKQRKVLSLSDSHLSGGSAEIADPTDLLTALFRGILGRNPDFAERESYFKKLVRPDGISSVLAELVRSQGFADRFGRGRKVCPNPAASYNKETIVFSQIHGTSEDSLLALLKGSFGEKEVFALQSDSLHEYAPGELAEYSVFAGYFSHDSLAYIPRRNLSNFTMVAEPKARLISLYYFWRSQEPKEPSRHSGTQLAKDLTFEAFVASEEIRKTPEVWNHMTWAIMGDRKWRIWRKMLTNSSDEESANRFIASTVRPAIRNRMRKFLFVGLHEDFETSVKTLFRLLKRPDPENHILNNASQRLAEAAPFFRKEDKLGTAISQLDALLKPLNVLDEIIYNEARELYAAHLILPFSVD